MADWVLGLFSVCSRLRRVLFRRVTGAGTEMGSEPECQDTRKGLGDQLWESQEHLIRKVASPLYTRKRAVP